MTQMNQEPHGHVKTAPGTLNMGLIVCDDCQERMLMLSILGEGQKPNDGTLHPAVMLDDWGAVIRVVGLLMETANAVFGPPDATGCTMMVIGRPGEGPGDGPLQ